MDEISGKKKNISFFQHYYIFPRFRLFQEMSRMSEAHGPGKSRCLGNLTFQQPRHKPRMKGKVELEPVAKA